MTATLRARWLEFSDEQAAAYIVLCVSTAPREPATLALVEVVCDAAGLTHFGSHGGPDRQAPPRLARRPSGQR